MNLQIAIAFVTYAFVTSITPGPNNTMLLSSGVNHGFLRSIPHILGVNLGFAPLQLAVGLGFGAVLTAVPILHGLLTGLGAIYLLWLAWKVAHSGPMEGDVEARAPLTFLQAAAFQWVNPKTWVMATGAATTFLPTPVRMTDLVMLTIGYAVVNLPCITLWNAFGVALRRVLTNPRAARAFNWAMAAALVLSLVPLVRDAWG